MGSGGWFKSMARKKTKLGLPKNTKGTVGEQPNGSSWRNRAHKMAKNSYLTGSIVNPEKGATTEDIAATRIQTAFRAFKARKAFRYLKCTKRLHFLSQRLSVKKQISTTSRYLHSWIRIESEIRARRASMVTEGRLKQKKQENQSKLEAELHDLEVEWCGGHKTMEEILARIQQREEAAVKRERAMAYAFSHQWRASTGLKQGQLLLYDAGKGGWSWVDRWIAARPWETRLPARDVGDNRGRSKAGKAFVKKANSLSIRGEFSLTKLKSSDARVGESKKPFKPADEKSGLQGGLVLGNPNHSNAREAKKKVLPERLRR